MQCLVLSASISQRGLRNSVFAMSSFLLSLNLLTKLAMFTWLPLYFLIPFGLWLVRDFCCMLWVASCHALLCHDMLCNELIKLVNMPTWICFAMSWNFTKSESVNETCYVYMGAIISSDPFWLMVSKGLLFYAFSRFMPCLVLLG